MTRVAKELIIFSIIGAITLPAISYFFPQLNDGKDFTRWFWCSWGFVMAYWLTDIRKLAKSEE